MQTMTACANVLIAFSSRTGFTEALANGIAAGARRANAKVRLRRVRPPAPEAAHDVLPGFIGEVDAISTRYASPTEVDAEWADAIVLGSPGRLGAPAAELNAYIDRLDGLWLQGRLNGKAASAFASSGRPHGKEATILLLYAAAAHLGMVIVPTEYAGPSLFEARTPDDFAESPSPADLAVAHMQGRRIAKIAGLLRVSRDFDDDRMRKGPVLGEAGRCSARDVALHNR